VIAPDGSEVARLGIPGERGAVRDRMVAGTLRVDLPVPVRDAQGVRAPPPPFVRWERAWLALWIALPWLILARAWLRGRSRGRSHGPAVTA
jgi:hypothetical protein